MKYEHIRVCAHVYDGALKVVNEIRKAIGARPRKKLAAGVQGMADDCPLSNSIGDGYDVWSNGSVAGPKPVKLNREKRAALARVVRLVDKYDGDNRVILVRGAL